MKPPLLVSFISQVTVGRRAYQVKDCIANGWNVVCYPVEIGAQSFVRRSMVKLMKELGLGGKERRIKQGHVLLKDQKY